MTRELFNRPLQRVVFRHIRSAASGSIEIGTLHILWNRHEDIHVVGDAALLVVALHLHYEPNLGV
jgi:hypothetical protein